jgi:hypothetical protein
MSYPTRTVQYGHYYHLIIVACVSMEVAYAAFFFSRGVWESASLLRTSFQLRSLQDEKDVFIAIACEGVMWSL